MAIFNDKKDKQFRRDLRKAASFGERVMWNGLRGNKLGAKFRRQESIGAYIVDFYCPELRLAVEVKMECITRTRENMIRSAMKNSRRYTFERYDSPIRK